MLPRLVHVGLGPLGRRVVADCHARRLGRVVAAVDVAPDLVGRDLAELVPGGPSGVRVQASLGEIEDWSGVRCALVTTSSDLELCMELFRELLPRGVSVASTCEELAWPWLRHPVLAQELHELCVRHGARVLGTGVNPGFLMDALPVAVSTACHEVRAVRVERVQDAGSRRLPFQRKIGVGLAPEAFGQRVEGGSLRHVGLGESLFFLAHYLGFALDAWEEDVRPVLAEAQTASAVGPVAPGHARGVRQVASGTRDGRTVLELVFHAAVGEPAPEDRITIDGEPRLELAFRGGVHGDAATSAVLLNSLRPLLAAEAGLHTMASLPLQGCAAAVLPT